MVNNFIHSMDPVIIEFPVSDTRIYISSTAWLVLKIKTRYLKIVFAGFFLFLFSSGCGCKFEITQKRRIPILQRILNFEVAAECDFFTQICKEHKDLFFAIGVAIAIVRNSLP